MCPGFWDSEMELITREEDEQQDKRKCLASMAVHNIMIHYMEKEGIKNENWRNKRYKPKSQGRGRVILSLWLD